jgi:hypothetical protein
VVENRIPEFFYKRYLVFLNSMNVVDSNTKCNFEQLGKEVKDVLVSKASRPASQSSHDLSTPEHKLTDIRFISS